MWLGAPGRGSRSHGFFPKHVVQWLCINQSHPFPYSWRAPCSTPLAWGDLTQTTPPWRPSWGSRTAQQIRTASADMHGVSSQRRAHWGVDHPTLFRRPRSLPLGRRIGRTYGTTHKSRQSLQSTPEWAPPSSTETGASTSAARAHVPTVNVPPPRQSHSKWSSCSRRSRVTYPPPHRARIVGTRDRESEPRCRSRCWFPGDWGGLHGGWVYVYWPPKIWPIKSLLI
jgi:hypothetical protein